MSSASTSGGGGSTTTCTQTTTGHGGDGGQKQARPPHDPNQTVMTAVVRSSYGNPADILRIEHDVQVPSPGPMEVLVKVRASSINQGDVHVATGTPCIVQCFTGCCSPSGDGFGQDFAGDIVEIGADVRGFEVGDAVYGQSLFGATLAEYAVIKADSMAKMPSNMTYEEAACVPIASATALIGLKLGPVEEGTKVLINGATGSVGPFAIQIAHSLGASHIAAVCSEEKKPDLEAFDGVSEVFAYESEDYTVPSDRTPEGGYDVIFDVVSSHSFSDNKRVLAEHGVLVYVGGPGTCCGFLCKVCSLTCSSCCSSQTAKMLTSEANRDTLEEVRDMIEAGTVRAHISKVFPLDEAVEAFEYRRKQHPAFKTVVTVDGYHSDASMSYS